jgi:hypothetical protein
VSEHDVLFTTDAHEWARAFCQRFATVSRGSEADPDDDEGLMISWFANAIETGRLAGCKATEAAQPSYYALKQIIAQREAHIAELEAEVVEWKGKAELYRQHTSPTADSEWASMEALLREARNSITARAAFKDLIDRIDAALPTEERAP